jgi:hypothetical protein
MQAGADVIKTSRPFRALLLHKRIRILALLPLIALVLQLILHLSWTTHGRLDHLVDIVIDASGRVWGAGSNPIA